MAYLQDFLTCAQNNSTLTMDYYDDILTTREYNEPSLTEFRKIINDAFLSFCFNNGLFNRIKGKEHDLNDNEKAILKTLNLNSDVKVRNKYLIKIINYYYNHLKSKFNEFNFEEDFKDLLNDMYSGTPCAYLIRTKGYKFEDLKTETLNPDPDLIKYTSEFIKIGECIQFNIDGFQRNQFIYLLVGIAIADVMNNFQNTESTLSLTFRQLIQHLLNYLHLLMNVKAFDLSKIDFNKVEGNKEGRYSLITFTEFKRNGQMIPNHRYTPAKKYFEAQDLKQSNATKYITDDKGSYIITEYSSSDEVNIRWNDLENEFKTNGISDDLIKMWFDSQLLTRSTCLVGVILIILKTKKYIKFKQDEMPDWAAIAGKDYITTFDELDDLKVPKVKNITVEKVLCCLNNYVENIKNMK